MNAFSVLVGLVLTVLFFSAPKLAAHHMNALSPRTKLAIKVVVGLFVAWLVLAYFIN